MRTYIVPGRVELAGKHVDYAGGRSLTCAVDLAITATAHPLKEPVVRIRDLDRGSAIEVPISRNATRARTMPLWSTYALAVVRRFARDFPDARTGVDISLRSNLPPSAGLSSSSALIVSIAMALTDANQMSQESRWTAAVPNALARAEYFSAMETGAPYLDFPGNHGVGVRGGAQDPIAIMCACENSVGQFSYLPARIERRIDWPADYVIAVGVSGVHATKTGNARAQYNRASDATRDLVRAWNAAAGRADITVMDALVSSPDAASSMQALATAGTTDFSADVLVPRLAQFREEVDVIVPGVAEALARRDLIRLGTLMDRSQQLAEQALGNQVRETVHLARSARNLGAVAASAFGAGFGGSVWAMVSVDEASHFIDQWRASYCKSFPSRATASQWIVVTPGPART